MTGKTPTRTAPCPHPTMNAVTIEISKPVARLIIDHLAHLASNTYSGNPHPMLELLEETQSTITRALEQTAWTLTENGVEVHEDGSQIVSTGDGMVALVFPGYTVTISPRFPNRQDAKLFHSAKTQSTR